jgi:aspartyl protease family protein
VTNGLQFGSIYILFAVMLVGGVLMSRAGGIGRTFVAAVGWLIVFAAGFVLFTFRDDFGFVSQRLRAEATGEPVRQGKEMRVPMALDGHFWVDATVNGQKVKFLVDSGATMTTIGPQTAAKADVDVSPKADQLSGLVPASSKWREHEQKTCRSAPSGAVILRCTSPRARM